MQQRRVNCAQRSTPKAQPHAATSTSSRSRGGSCDHPAHSLSPPQTLVHVVPATTCWSFGSSPASHWAAVPLHHLHYEQVLTGIWGSSAESQNHLLGFPPITTMPSPPISTVLRAPCNTQLTRAGPFFAAPLFYRAAAWTMM